MVKKVDIIASIGAQDRTGNAFRQVNQNIQRMGAGADRTAKTVTRNFGLMRGASTQFGYQIQDVAVQLQSGQNAMLVFGQQGSQIASIFGPGGAIIGAFLAVGAALGTALLPKLFGAEKALADVEQQLSSVRDMMKLTEDGTGVLTSKFEELAKVSKDLARSALLQAYNSALIATTQSQRELTEATEDFSKTFAIFTTAQPIKDLQDQFDITREKAMMLYDASREIRLGDFAIGAKQMRDTLVDLIDPVSGANVEFRVMAGEVLGLLEKYDQATDSASELNQMLAELEAGGDLVTQSSRDQVGAIDEQILALQREADQLGMTARAKVIYNAVQEGASPDQLSQLVAIHDRIAAYKEEQQVLADTSSANEAFIRGVVEHQTREMELYRKNSEEKKRIRDSEKQAEMALFSSRLAVIGQLAGAMESAYKEGSKAQKAAFIVSKGVAAAEAVINAELAAVKALAELPPPQNVIYSNIIRGLGYASAATIVGTSLGSFEGGGFTGTGARAGGLDGKGGFPAILHPNETVIDHTKGGGAPVNVNFTIVANDTQDFDRLLMSRRGQIIGMVNQAMNNRGRRGVV